MFNICSIVFNICSIVFNICSILFNICCSPHIVEPHLGVVQASSTSPPAKYPIKKYFRRRADTYDPDCLLMTHDSIAQKRAHKISFI